jgi:hypothetical protein
MRSAWTKGHCFSVDSSFSVPKKAWPNKASPTPSPGDVDSRCAAAVGARHKTPSELNAEFLLANLTDDDRCAFKKATAREI